MAGKYIDIGANAMEFSCHGSDQKNMIVPW
jgi:hypothetical protein